MALSSLPMPCRSGAQAIVRQRHTSRQVHPGRIDLRSRSMADSGTILVDEVGRRPSIELFSSLPEAKLLAEQQRIEYNLYRPHSALQGRTPLEFLQEWNVA